MAALVATALVVGGPSRGAEPQCRFPGPWKRTAGAVRRAEGGHLSPLEIATDPTILAENGRYRMWFTNADSLQHTGPAYAESTDGVTWSVWTRPAGRDPLMDLALVAPPDGWDSSGIETPFVLRLPDGGYRLYYTGDMAPEGSVTYAIGAADSVDGLTWTRRARPVLEGIADWERPDCANPSDPSTCRRGGVLEPSVLYDPTAKLYRLWYVGLGELAGSFRTYRIGYATSPDGLVWTRRPQPVFDLGAGTSWDSMWTSHVEVVADPKAGFHMFYFGSALKDYRDGVEIQRGSIGHAYSPDGVAWTRDPANPILTPRPGQSDAWSVGGPTVLVEGGRMRLWYFGNPTGGLRSNIFEADAACGP